MLLDADVGEAFVFLISNAHIGSIVVLHKFIGFTDIKLQVIDVAPYEKALDQYYLSLERHG